MVLKVMQQEERGEQTDGEEKVEESWGSGGIKCREMEEEGG